MNDSKTTIEEMKQKLKQFIDERDWEKFHLPKDVALALSIEVSEILEHFRFKSNEEIAEFLTDPKKKEEIADEIGDTMGFLVDLARVCDIDLAEAFEKKMAKNEIKYPKEIVRGKNHKYTHYDHNKQNN